MGAPLTDGQLERLLVFLEGWSTFQIFQTSNCYQFQNKIGDPQPLVPTRKFDP